MNKPKVFLAVAGAGKTYSICNSLDVSKRNLIISFTHENVFNINQELKKRIGYIPDNIIVTTFDSFLVKNFIWPHFNHIQSDIFNKKPICTRRVSLLRYPFDPSNLYAMKKTAFSHYFIDNNQNRYLKLENTSEMIIEKQLCFRNEKTIFDVGVERLKRFFDYIYIDEFQDYRQSDYELIMSLASVFKKCFLYGDYFQHSVSGQNNTGQPFGKNSDYNSFIKLLNKRGFEVDTQSLSKTRRCSEAVCRFIRENMDIPIHPEETMNRSGTITYVFDNEKLKTIISVERPIILSLTSNQLWHSRTFGISKGDTFTSTVVVLPDSTLYRDLNNELKIIRKINSKITRNKVYVALTRSSGNVYITNKATMDEVYG